MKRLFACAAIAAGVSLTASAAYEDVTWLQYVEGDGGAYLTTDYTPNPAKDTITIDVELVVSSGAQTIFAAVGISKSGSPAEKLQTECPSAFSCFARSVMASVSEGWMLSRALFIL